VRISKLFKIILFLLPLLEIAGFIIVGDWLGVFPTLLLIIITTIAGLVILRTQGFMILIQVQRRMQAGEHPAVDVFGGALLMLGGLLLVLPGFITDIVGLLLLIPRIRSLVLSLLIRKGTVVQNGRVIEGEFHRENHKK